MGSSFKTEKIINTYDITADGRLSPVTALNYFQEIAQRHLESLDIGLDFNISKNLAWILVKYEIEFLSYPTAEEKVIVETEAVGFNRFEAFRSFTISSEKGDPIILGKSVWVLADTKTGRLVRINNVEDLLKLDSLEGNVYKIPRLKNLEDHDHERSFDVRYLDIDINQHVNNTKYLAWAVESLPLETIRKEEIKKLTIIYKEQAFYGEEVIVKSKKIENNLWRIDITKTDGTVLCQIQIESRERDRAFNGKRAIKE